MNKNLFSRTFLISFILLSIFIVIETENYKFIESKPFIFIIIINIILITTFFFKKIRFLIYINFLVFFVLIFLVNLFLFITDQSISLSSNKIEFIIENNYNPTVPPITHLRTKNKILPLSGLSNVKTVTANENGYWGIFDSDEYGFNNIKGQHRKILNTNNKRLIFLGDSMTQGSAVNQNENFVSLINENSDFTTLNLAYGGNGLLLSLATYKEYGNHIKNSNVIFCFYEGNDFFEYEVEEKNNEILKKYLNKNYSQNLINSNYEKDNLVKKKVLLEKKSINNNKFKEKLNYYYYEIIKLNNLRKRIGLLNNNKEIYAYNKENFKVFEDILDHYQSLVSENSSTFTFIYIPAREHFYVGSPYNNVYQKIINILNAKNIKYIDLYKEMINSKNPLDFFPRKVMRHFSAEGHKKLSKIIIKNLN